MNTTTVERSSNADLQALAAARRKLDCATCELRQARLDHLIAAMRVIKAQSTGPDWTAEQALAFTKNYAGEAIAAAVAP